MVALAMATSAGLVLARAVATEPYHGVAVDFTTRVRTWWWMAVIFALATMAGGAGSVVLFGFLSFLALREFITVTHTRLGDHHTLFWSIFVLTPLQYVLVAMGYYELFTLLIPVYAFLLVPLRSAIAGDTRQFLERVAKIQWGLMLCVYCVSHAPALLTLHIAGYHQPAKLLLFLVVVDETSDAVQYGWSKLWGGRPIAPSVVPRKTVEGTVAGVAVATVIGGMLSFATPFTAQQAAAMALAIALMGFAGSLTMAAIKRDRGIKMFGGMLDQVDSICFSAPVFFHLTRYFFA